MPNIKLPKEKLANPEDARRQIRSAMSHYEDVFGRRPRGMWPSEGSVSTDAVRIMAEEGLLWAASDEEVLLETLKKKRGPELIYAPYRVQLDGIGLNLVFRDKSLSDLIGFSYSKSAPRPAAEDLSGHLHNIHKTLRPTSGENVVGIFLDGENAWEHYPDGGKKFLSTLYSLLANSEKLEAITIGDYLDHHPPRMNLNRIFSGSWISHNFNIWIGRREDNLAWELLARTRKFLEAEQDRRTDITPEVWEKAWEAIYAAEGSDWFWWYGDDFSSDFDSEFDRLFRSYLMRVYQLLGANVPSYLDDPIINLGAARPTEQPTALIKPEIDGRVTHYYEWVGAGKLDVRKFGGAMNISETCISHLYWGFDLDTLFMRIDTANGPREGELQEAEIRVHLHAEKPLRIRLAPPLTPDAAGRVLVERTENEKEWTLTSESDRIRAEKIIEFAIDFRQLGLSAGDEFKFHVAVHKGPIEIERWPRSGYLQFAVPGEDFEASMWLV